MLPRRRGVGGGVRAHLCRRSCARRRTRISSAGCRARAGRSRPRRARTHSRRRGSQSFRSLPRSLRRGGWVSTTWRRRGRSWRSRGEGDASQRLRTRGYATSRPETRTRAERSRGGGPRSTRAFLRFTFALFFVALPRWGCRVLTGRGFTRGGSEGARRRDWAFHARCGLVASLRGALCGRSSRLEGRKMLRAKGARLFQVSKISNWRFFARETPTSGKRTKTNRRS